MPTIRFHLTCSACDTDLHGVDLYDNCPTCDAPVAGSIDLNAIDADEMIVTADVRCAACGYNLRMLPLDGVCPECATAVAGSVRPDSLHYADANWLDRTATGVRTLIVALIGAPVILVLTEVISRIANGGFAAFVMLLLAVATLPLLLFSLAAIFNISASDPAARPTDFSPWNRRVAQGFAIFVAPLAVLIYVMYASSRPGPGGRGFALGVTVLLLFAVPAAIVATLRCLRRVAERARRADLARKCTHLVWLTCVAGSFIAVASLLSMFQPYLFRPPAAPAAPQFRMSPVRIAIALSLLLGTLITLVEWVYAVVVLLRFRRLLAGIQKARPHLTGPMAVNVEHIEGLD